MYNHYKIQSEHRHFQTSDFYSVLHHRSFESINFMLINCILLTLFDKLDILWSL